ncbi:unnamed protein product [Arabis nemorensis]|uniref:Uncharacterized protein n=1 Tax=Arabis nemorensis TaxID=586526 RepID=A0A565CK35_9BRAS|nr:unnamed protein product [Arabis nemorensis]
MILLSDLELLPSSNWFSPSFIYCTCTSSNLPESELYTLVWQGLPGESPMERRSRASLHDFGVLEASPISLGIGRYTGFTEDISSCLKVEARPISG